MVIKPVVAACRNPFRGPRVYQAYGVPVTDLPDNQALLERFYAAFARHDGAAMAGCYAPEARFDDPVFTGLRGDEPGAMWRMLTRRSADLTVELVAYAADGDQGSADWVARYTFAQTGRSVTNRVHSTFRFADGLIVEQVDTFDFHRWARQALGPVGMLLGWTPYLRGSVGRRARAGLDSFRASEHS
jgi:ketosteroid isomerase-like protein